MQCPRCQSENRETARFCSKCGSQLAGSEPAAAPVDPAASPMSPPEDAPEDLNKAIETRVAEAEPLSSAPPPAPAQEDVAAEPAPANEAGQAADTGEHAGPESSGAEPAELQQDAVPEPPPIVALSPLPPAVKIAGRFIIDALVEAAPGINVYEALDYGYCPTCRATDNVLDDEYCRQCGADLKVAGVPVRRRLQEALSPEVLGAAPGEGVLDNGRFYRVASPEPSPDVAAAGPEPVKQSLALAAGFASHVGMVRELDEDSLFVATLSGVFESVVAPSVGVYIVADGMGGHEGGEVASKLAVEMIAGHLLTDVLTPRIVAGRTFDDKAVADQIKGAIEAANAEVYRLARERNSDMGCTLTMALVLDGVAYIANVGDSRTYVFRQGQLHQITEDHSLVARLVATGVLTPDEIYTHPDRSAIYRGIAIKGTVEVDIWAEPLESGDVLLLCCDGLWEAIRPEGIEEALLTQTDPQAACAEMVRRANQAGGDDNISVIAVRAAEVQTAAFLP